MRGRTLAALAALAVVDIAVLALGYRAHNGSLPPMQRSSGAFAVDASPTAEPSGPAAAGGDVTGPALLGVNSAGVVLLATRGACEARFDDPARLWTGDVDDGAPLAAVEAPAISEVLGLMVYDDDSLRVSGLDEECNPVTFDSDDGVSWRASDSSGVWRLDSDITASRVTTPSGKSEPTPCVADLVLNLPDRQGIASCDEGSYVMLVPKLPVTSMLTADGYSRLSVTPHPDAERHFVLGTTDACTASVGLSVPDSQRVDQLACFDEGKAPLAIASAEGVLVAQLGNDLKVSRDDGETFETLGQAEPGEESTAAAS